MNFDRSWCEDAGSEDSNGRTLWALGVVARDAQMAKHHDWARALYDQTAAIAFDLGSPRAEAFAMLVAAAMLDISPDHALARRTLAQVAEGSLELLGRARRPEWTGSETVTAYVNDRLPAARPSAGPGPR